MDPWSSSLTGQGPRPRPHVGPLPPPSLGDRFSGWLGGLGMLPTQAGRWGSTLDMLPPGQAFSGGQNLAAGWDQGDLGQMALGAGSIGLAAAPMAWPRPAPRMPGLSFGPGDVQNYLRDAGARNVRLRQARSSDSSYVDFGSRSQPHTVRIPGGNLHAQPPGAADFGRLIDTGTSMRTPRTHNAAGQPYSDWDTLTAELQRIINSDKPKRGPVPGIGAAISIGN